WSDVQLSLVAGAPLAFEAQLGTPVIPSRPIVTDSGEVIAAMPKGETSVADRDADGIPDKKDAEKPADAPAAEPPAPPPPPPVGSPAPATGAAATTEDASKVAKERAKAEQGAMGGLNQPAPAREHFLGPSQPRSVHSLAAIAVQGG